MTERERLLREAAEFDRKEAEDAERVNEGSGSDSLCAYHHARARHLRFLAADADDTEPLD